MVRTSLLLTCLLLAGCRPAGRGAGPRAPKTGPSLDRLAGRLLDPALSAAEKEAYWESVRGTLVRATGNVVSADGRIVLEVPPSEKRSFPICVAAAPDAANAPALPSLRPGQKLAVLGELAARELAPQARSSCRIAFELRNARIMIK